MVILIIDRSSRWNVCLFVKDVSVSANIRQLKRNNGKSSKYRKVRVSLLRYRKVIRLGRGGNRERKEIDSAKRLPCVNANVELICWPKLWSRHLYRCTTSVSGFFTCHVSDLPGVHFLPNFHQLYIFVPPVPTNSTCGPAEFSNFRSVHLSVLRGEKGLNSAIQDEPGTATETS